MMLYFYANAESRVQVYSLADVISEPAALYFQGCRIFLLYLS